MFLETSSLRQTGLPWVVFQNIGMCELQNAGKRLSFLFSFLWPEMFQ